MPASGTAARASAAPQTPTTPAVGACKGVGRSRGALPAENLLDCLRLHAYVRRSVTCPRPAVRVLNAARRHGVHDDDIMHAYRNPMMVISDDDVRMTVGGARDGHPIELGVSYDQERHENRIIHAMPARDSYVQRLTWR